MAMLLLSGVWVDDSQGVSILAAALSSLLDDDNWCGIINCIHVCVNHNWRRRTFLVFNVPSSEY